MDCFSNTALSLAHTDLTKSLVRAVQIDNGATNAVLQASSNDMPYLARYIDRTRFSEAKGTIPKTW